MAMNKRKRNKYDVLKDQSAESVTTVMQKQEDQHCIKIGRFQYKSNSFWITLLCVFLIFVLLSIMTICYTVFKIQQLHVQNGEGSIIQQKVGPDLK